MRRSEQIGSLAAALVAVQAEARDVFKGKEGYGYNYADLSSVLETVRPLLSKHGLSFTQLPGAVELDDKVLSEPVRDEKGKPTGNFQPVHRLVGSVSLTTMIMHAASGEYIESEMTMPFEEKKGLSSAQSVGMIITYMRRYSLTSLVGVAATDDMDAAEPPLITTDELKGLRAVMTSAGMDEERVCAHYGVNTLGELSQDQYAAVLRVIDKKRRAQGDSSGQKAVSLQGKSDAKVQNLKTRVPAK